MKKAIFLIGLAGVLVLHTRCEFGMIFGEEGYDIFARKNKAPTPEYLEYLEQVKAQPLDFQIPASEDAAAWKRARYILKKYGWEYTSWCSRKFKISSDDVLEKDADKHYSGHFEDVGYLFRIVRVPASNMTNYTVRFAPAVTSAGWYGSPPSNEAHAQVIAYYISSGKFMKRVLNPDYFEKLFK